MSRNRKLSTAGSEHPLSIDYTRPKPETIVKELVAESSSLPMREAAPHQPLCEAKSYSEESSHVISKSSHPIGRNNDTEEERGRMEVDIEEEPEDLNKVIFNFQPSIFKIELSNPKSLNPDGVNL